MKLIKYIYFTSCRELPLYKFIQCLESGDHTNLSRFNFLKFRFKFLKILFDNIFFDYLDLVKDSKVLQTLALTKEKILCESKYNLVYNVLNCIYKSESLDTVIPLVDKLKKMGFRYKFEYLDRDSFTKDLMKIGTSLKTLKLRIDDIKKDLDNLQKPDGGATTKNSFDTILVDLSKHQGYRIDPKKVTVSEFAATLNRYKDYIEAANKANKKGS